MVRGWWWISPEPYNSVDFIVLGIFMVVNASFFMGLFFMISAYFIPSSLQRKGATRFLKNRLIKLGVPIVIFVSVVFPLMDYLLLGQPMISFRAPVVSGTIDGILGSLCCILAGKKAFINGEAGLSRNYCNPCFYCGHGPRIIRCENIGHGKLLAAVWSVGAFPSYSIHHALCLRHSSVQGGMD